MDGLECSEIMLSQTKHYEPFRIDSHFYEKQYKKLKETLSSFHCASLKELVKKPIQTGHTPSMANNSYYGGSIALIKTDNLHDNSISTTFSDYLTEAGNSVISRTELADKDIITTIIGATEHIIARSAIVTKELLPANINQNIVQIRINNEKIAPEYVNIYLNTKFGKGYLIYLSRQTEQFNLNCKEVETVLIPILSEAFQKDVAMAVVKAQEYQTKSRLQYKKAEHDLATLLNVHIQIQNRPVLSVKNISESFAVSGRLDAEYYQPKYEVYDQLIKSFPNGWAKISDVFKPIKAICNRSKKSYRYVEIGDVDIRAGAATSNEIATCNLPDNAKILTCFGDVLVSTVRPNRGAVAILEEDGLLVSGAFTVLRQTNNYPKEVLQVLLRTELYKDWLLQTNVGTSYPVIKDADVLNMPIPIFTEEVNSRVIENIQSAFTLRKQAKKLLAAAVRAVEIAIEDGEGAAMEYLEENRK